MFSFISSHRRCSVIKVFLKISLILQETPVLESLFNKVAGLQACNFIKKRLQHRYFPVKIAKFFKKTFFEEYLRKTASVVSFSWHLFWSLFLMNLQVLRFVTLLKRDFSTGVFMWICKNTYFEEYLRATVSVVSFSWLYVHYLRHRFINQKENVKKRVHIFRKIKNKDRLK